MLLRDGRFFTIAHSGDNPQADIPFDQPLPTSPAGTLSIAKRDEIAARLDAEHFFTQARHQADPRAEDGAFVVLRARGAGGEHAVVWENVEPPLVEFLFTVAP